MAIIEIKNLKKSYGKNIGTWDVSFSVEKGELFGFVGPNGAGKSTTIKSLLGFIFPEGGSAFIEGLDAYRESKKIKEITGYVPSDVNLYSDMSIAGLLHWNGCFFNREEYRNEAERLCVLLELDTSKRFSQLSTGNRKKAAIVCAMASKPAIIILDEPTNGLDPIAQKKLFLELKKQTADGVTVLLSSHNLAEVQEYCDRVAFIKDGKILAVTDLKEIHPNKIITVTGGHLEAVNDLDIISRDEEKCAFRHNGSSAELIELLGKINPDDFTAQTESIEEQFMSMYGRGEVQK